jgi:hypothetical protein
MPLLQYNRTTAQAFDKQDPMEPTESCLDEYSCPSMMHENCIRTKLQEAAHTLLHGYRSIDISPKHALA